MKLNRSSVGTIALLTLLGLSTILASLLIPSRTALANGGWLSGWSYRRQLTIDGSKVDAALTDFPVLVKLDSSFFDFSKAKTGGADICLTSSDGTTLLKHEIERWNSTAQKAEIWVKIPSVSAGSSTAFYMYYGNPVASDAQDPASVWNTDFKLVQHLKETSGVHQDSTLYNNDGTAVGATQGATGMIDGADSFDGTNDYVNCGNSSSLTATQFSLEAWIRRVGSGTSQTTGSGGLSLEPIVSKGRNQVDTLGLNVNYFFGTNSSGFLGFDFEDNVNGGNHPTTGNTALTTGQWYHVVVTYNGTTVIYINGNLDRSALISFTPDYNPWPAAIGSAISDEGGTGTPKGFFNGTIDEVRISSSGRSAAWIKASYNSGNNSLLTYGSEQVFPSPTFSDISYNATRANGPCEFRVKWNDPHGLDKCIFSTNNAGNWENMSVTVSGTESWASYSLVLNSTVGTVVGFRWYCNDTLGNMGDTGIRTLTTDDWPYFMKLQFDNSGVAESLTDFPVLINLTRAGTSFWSHVNSSYNDLRFTDSDGVTSLYFEVEYWNYAGNEGLVWVKIPQIDASSTTDFIYLYYGNPNPPANAYHDPTKVWDSNYVLVLHLSEASGTRYDSTANNNDATPYGGLAKAVSGKIDGADNFDNTDDYLEIPDSNSLDYGDVVTLEAWFNPNLVGANSFYGGIDKGTGTIYMLGNNNLTSGQQYGAIRLGLSGTGTDVCSNTALSAGSWSYAVGTKNGADARIYINGVLDNQRTTTAYTGTNNANSLRIGKRPTQTEYLNSVADEIRISKIARSAGWIKAQYLSMSDSYVTFGSEEIVFVIPEYLLGAIMALVACFAAFMVFTRAKRAKTRSPCSRIGTGA
jgi:hypothetical protein